VKRLLLSVLLLVFSLSQGAILIKSEKNKRSLKKALINELTIAKDSISYAQSSSNKMPKDKLPLITEVYDTNKRKLASILNVSKIITGSYGICKD
jgi:hypothetical protein